MDLSMEQILEIVDIYQKRIDWAVRGQIDSILTEGEDASEQNPNAMRYAREFVEVLHNRDYIDEYDHEQLTELFTPDEEDD